MSTTSEAIKDTAFVPRTRNIPARTRSSEHPLYPGLFSSLRLAWTNSRLMSATPSLDRQELGRQTGSSC